MELVNGLLVLATIIGTTELLFVVRHVGSLNTMLPEETERWRRITPTVDGFIVVYIGGVLAAAAGFTEIGIATVGLALVGTTTCMMWVLHQGRLVMMRLQEARKEAEEASKGKSIYLANMSHELRTPLNSIIGYSELLKEDPEIAELAGAASDLGKIVAAGHHLLSMINNILDLSKIEAGKMQINLTEFDVAMMLDEVSTTVRPQIEKNGNRLVTQIAPDLGVMVSDVTKLRQTLLNLLNNAAKFTEEGEITLTAARSTNGDADWLTFKVSDTGVGMTPEQLRKVFAEYSQADAGCQMGGTGLGLTISRRLCQLMGGSISADSEAGKGSTFMVKLPMQTVAESNEKPLSPTPHPTEGTMVLVIDDDGAVREFMQYILTSEGYFVETAPTGSDGLRLARARIPDIITLDVKMPGMDGWTVLESLKSQTMLAHIPVIMLTSVDDEVMNGVIGVAEYLAKPIDETRLLATLSKY